jgi:dipeptidase E
MELLLLSSSRTPAGYLTDYLPEIRDFAGGIRRALFIPFAAVRLPWEEFARRVREASGLTLTMAQDASDVEDHELVIVGGGNTFQLLKECRERGFLESIHARVSQRKMKYLGWSAGANLACPTIRTTNDMPIVDPGSLEALGLIAFQINPHYVSVSLPGHHGGERFYDLMRIAMKRDDPSFLADKVASKFTGAKREEIRLRLMNMDNWYIPLYE